MVSKLFSVITTEHYPNVTSIAKQLSGGNATREGQLVAYAKSCVQPAYAYFQEKFNHDLNPAVFAFKAARCFSPYKLYDLKPTATDIDSLRRFTFLDSDPVIDGLKSELSAYKAAAEGLSVQTDPITWWKMHESDLHNWAKAFKLILLVQPSSAASERVFSILSNSFSDHQESSLEDYIQLSVMLQYNYRS